METVEGNKLIAEFCFETTKNKVYRWKAFGDQWANEGLRFHDSWGWIKTAVDKINDIYASDTPHIWQGELNARIDEVILLPICTPIETVWQAVIQFITWYNTTKKQTNDTRHKR